MGITYYMDYVNHCLRFYVTHTDATDFISDVDKANWTACKDAFSVFDEHQRQLLRELYSRRVPMGEAVKEISADNNISADYLWKILKSLQKDVAKRRGLL